MKDEEKGRKHYLFYSDANNVYAYDPVLNTSVVTLVTGLISIRDIVVDLRKKWLFVNDFNATSGVGTVHRYTLVTNFTNILKPTLSINSTLTTVVYTGKEVTGISVD